MIVRAKEAHPIKETLAISQTTTLLFCRYKLAVLKWITNNDQLPPSSTDYMLKDLENRLRDRAVKPTAMRLLVLDELSKQSAAMSLQDLEEAFEKADRITLYRTLKTFQEKGLVHSIEDGTGATKYALCEPGCECTPEDLHVHFHCHHCQKTFCLPKVSIPEFQLPPLFSLQEIKLTATGICAGCR